MPLSNYIMIGVSINNVQGITGKTYSIHDLVKAGVEADSEILEQLGQESKHNLPTAR